MTSSLTLKAETRKKEGKKTEAPLGTIPGILYGRGIKNVMLWFSRREFNRIREDAGESTIFKIKLENGEERNVLIKEIQRDILNGKPTHVDFYQVRMDEKIEANVELEFVGESPAVKDLGGILIKNMDEIEVKCLPGDLPPKIEVDISQIKTFDDYIYVKDLPVSDKVELLVDPENVVAMVSEPRSEEELAELETEVKEDVTKVEGVVKEEKPGEAGEAGNEEKEKEKKKEEKVEKAK
ncbi:MAG: 50S ribosomal protein L25 [Candidatus Moranbacteria bacterium]|nr:50S ribosomal protein L25 [Candidatus Moranbacteria bacterium]